jgi:ferric-dicitrate binding protein FerR (iron transport regulator)
MGNDASDDELSELERLLSEYPNHEHILSVLRSIQSKKLRQPAHNEELIVREAWEKLQGSLEPERAPRRMFFAVKWAAVWIGVIVISTLFYFQLRRPSKALMVAATVAHGKPQMKTLPDGSVVWINAGSKISYKEEQNSISVYLSGEAYFKVKHDPGRSFVVHAGNIAVKALGTAFNVLAYPGEGHVEATLIEGKVQVTMDEKPDQKIILAPNEKFTIVVRDTAAHSGISYEVKPVKIVPALHEAGEVAWMQDRLAFQDEPFSELAQRMERRYSVHMVFEDEALKKETISGIFKNEDVTKALRILQMTTSFQYRIKGDSILLWVQHDTVR